MLPAKSILFLTLACGSSTAVSYGCYSVSSSNASGHANGRESPSGGATTDTGVKQSDNNAQPDSPVDTTTTGEGLSQSSDGGSESRPLPSSGGEPHGSSPESATGKSTDSTDPSSTLQGESVQTSGETPTVQGSSPEGTVERTAEGTGQTERTTSGSESGVSS